MQGTSHRGFALAGAMAINSAIYAVKPAPMQNVWELALHVIGRPYTYHMFVLFWQHPTLLISSDLLTTFLYKLTFYLMLLACSSWPDRWEKKTLEDGTVETRFSPHRGPTHSILILILFISVFGFLYMFAMTYIQLYHVVVSPLILRELCAVAAGFFLAFVLHIIADMLTWDGVKVLWPMETDIGIPPIQRLRPTYGSPGEYIWLWTIIFVTGILFALNIVGI